jgi:predicted membrane-bound spermidine synthase
VQEARQNPHTVATGSGRDALGKPSHLRPKVLNAATLRPVLQVIFFVSGFAALLYQVVWQRSLYAIYGINIESVSVVVTAFMLGLGIGSFVGGALSKRRAFPCILVFSLAELAIGLFGCFSLGLFRLVGSVTLGAPPIGTALATFLLVLLPTMLMGGTLPLLVAHRVRASRNVGRSVGSLYFVNTLGSALASAAAPLVMMGSLGQTVTVRVAAVLNLLVSVSAFVLSRRSTP